MRTCHEPSRGCGFRKGGGLYLMSDGIGITCEVLPIATEICPACGHGIKPARGWTWIQPDLMLEGYLGPHGSEVHTRACPLGAPGRMGERCGLLWIGEQHYKTPEDWVSEGMRMGFSRRINNVPRGFVAGETWVLAAHRKAIQEGVTYRLGTEDKFFPSIADAMTWSNDHMEDIFADELKPAYRAGIFHVWRPTRIEYVVKGDETDEELEALEARGIEPVRVVPVQEQMREEVAS